MREFFVTFIALFVAVDIVGVLPLYLGFITELDVKARQRIAMEATLTAAGIGVGFLLLGDAVLRIAGVGVGDFQMAGGLLLLVLAIHDLLHPELPLRHPVGHLGVVPLGTPLIVGPAVLTTLLTLARGQGYTLTLLAFSLNLVLVWVALRWASAVVRVIGAAGARALAKVFGLLLAAIGVTLIRRGLELTLSGATPGYRCRAKFSSRAPAPRSRSAPDRPAPRPGSRPGTLFRPPHGLRGRCRHSRPIRPRFSPVRDAETYMRRNGIEHGKPPRTKNCHRWNKARHHRRRTPGLFLRGSEISLSSTPSS